MVLAGMVGIADQDEDLNYRGSLMKAASHGDVGAQRELMWRYCVWVYSPCERDAFVKSRGDLIGCSG